MTPTSTFSAAHVERFHIRCHFELFPIQNMEHSSWVIHLRIPKHIVLFSMGRGVHRRNDHRLLDKPFNIEAVQTLRSAA